MNNDLSLPLNCHFLAGTSREQSRFMMQHGYTPKKQSTYAATIQTPRTPG
jgi:hypothetical protein